MRRGATLLPLLLLLEHLHETSCQLLLLHCRLVRGSHGGGSHGGGSCGEGHVVRVLAECTPHAHSTATIATTETEYTVYTHACCTRGPSVAPVSAQSSEECRRPSRRAAGVARLIRVSAVVSPRLPLHPHPSTLRTDCTSYVLHSVHTD